MTKIQNAKFCGNERSLYRRLFCYLVHFLDFSTYFCGKSKLNIKWLTKHQLQLLMEMALDQKS